MIGLWAKRRERLTGKGFENAACLRKALRSNLGCNTNYHDVVPRYLPLLQAATASFHIHTNSLYAYIYIGCVFDVEYIYGFV